MGSGRAAVGPSAVAATLVVFVVVLLPAQAAPPLERTRYAGQTSQDLDLSFRTSGEHEGRRIVRLQVSFELTCRRGTLTSVRRAKFRQSGSFFRVSRSGRFKGSLKVKGDHAYEVRGGRVSLAGHFITRRRVEGRVRERLRLAEGLRCNSGAVRFNAHA
jgi:hypothetical protein